MRQEDPGVDSSAEEALPERESTTGKERRGEETVSQVATGVEREAEIEPSQDAGVESPPREADRANLLP